MFKQKNGGSHYLLRLGKSKLIQEAIGVGLEAGGILINGSQERLKGISIRRIQPLLDRGIILNLRQAMDRKEIL